MYIIIIHSYEIKQFQYNNEKNLLSVFMIACLKIFPKNSNLEKHEYCLY